MHFLQLLGRLARNDEGLVVSTSKIIHSLQRNMNGAEPEQVTKLLSYFTKPFNTVTDGDEPLRNPLGLMLESLLEKRDSAAPVGRCDAL